MAVSGRMPDRARNQVRGCNFEDFDDYGLGSGNGAGVGGGGSGAGWVARFLGHRLHLPALPDDINFEFTPGSG